MKDPSNLLLGMPFARISLCVKSEPNHTRVSLPVRVLSWAHRTSILGTQNVSLHMSYDLLVVDTSEVHMRVSTSENLYSKDITKVKQNA